MSYTKPEIDLNLKHYAGERSDVIKEVLLQIKKYLRNPEVPLEHRVIYSAIYNSLTYYKNISSLSITGETEGKTFLEKTICQINEDYKYLADKYGTDKTNPVITMKARIKSPISAMDKILDKVSEYVKEGRDLTLLNESLRDFIGIRVIIDPPSEIKAKGKQAESDYCYQIFDDLMKHHGVSRQLLGENQEENDYEFIPVSTHHDPNKLKKLKERPEKEGYSVDPDAAGVFIPKTRPDVVELYDEYFKDYRMWPKSMLYQRIHSCVHPQFEGYESFDSAIPTYIIPSKNNKPSMEYQFCTAEEEEYSEHGGASHTDYKDRAFYRLRIPLLMSLDKKQNKIRLHRLDESMEEFYGYSFKDMFNIDYQDFLEVFDTNERDDILAGIKLVSYNPEHNEYCLNDNPKAVLLDTSHKGAKFIKDLLGNASKEELEKFYDANGLLDGSIRVHNLPNPSKKKYVPSRKINIFSFTRTKKLKSKALQDSDRKKIDAIKAQSHDEH